MEKLSLEQQEILIGTMLGDGHLEKNGKNTRLRVDHSQKQREYVEWKYKAFQEWTISGPRLIDFFDTRTSKIYHHCRFTTLSLEVFNVYREMFYHERRKQLPINLSSLLQSYRSIAVWYMDDGYRRSDCKGLYLCTSSFTLDEQYLLQKCLADNFMVDTKIHWAAGNARLYIPAKKAEGFCEMIRPYMIESMFYKLL
jgi:hypothetical protein